MTATATKNTLTIDHLLGERTTASDSASLIPIPHGTETAEDKSYGLLNGDTGVTHWFPSTTATRKTVEWEETFNLLTGVLDSEEACPEHLIENFFEHKHDIFNADAYLHSTFDSFIAENLVSFVVELQAVTDALYLFLSEGDSLDDAQMIIDAPWGTVFVYSRNGRALASSLWDGLKVLFDTTSEQKRAMADKKLKKQSKASKKRKSASKARKANRK